MPDEQGNVIGVFPEAFALRDGEKYLSVTWLQFFSEDFEQGLVAAATAIRRQLDVRPRDGFTVGCVGAVREICIRSSVRVRILHEPCDVNEGYSAWRGMPSDNQDLFNLLAADAFVDTRPASAVPTP